MTNLIILLILAIIVLYGIKEYYQYTLGISPQGSVPAIVDTLAELLEESDSGKFLDLGSGYGGLVLGLARRLPQWQIHGVEVSPTPWLIANLRSIGKNYGTNYRFFLRDAFQGSLKGYDVIFIHQNPKIMKQWEVRLMRQLPPGTTLIVANHPLPRAKSTSTIKVGDKDQLFVYRKAARAEAPVPADLPSQENPENAAISPTGEVVEQMDLPLPEQG